MRIREGLESALFIALVTSCAVARLGETIACAPCPIRQRLGRAIERTAMAPWGWSFEPEHGYPRQR